MPIRCDWCRGDPLYIDYHDREWGVPLHDDRGLFEMLVLEGAQAGLSWLTILKKRNAYREAFDGFDIESVASYTESDVKRLLANQGIIRNRRKIESAIANGRAVVRIIERYGSLDDFLWRYVDHVPVQNAWKTVDQVPTESEISRRMSRDMKKAGFSFFGPVICYAFMQSVGMVNDHIVDCFRYHAVKQESYRPVSGR